MRIERKINNNTASLVREMFPGAELSNLPFATFSCAFATIDSINRGDVIFRLSSLRQAAKNGQSHTEIVRFGRTLDQFWADYYMSGLEPHNIATAQDSYLGNSFDELLRDKEKLGGVAKMKISMAWEDPIFVAVIGVVNGGRPTGLIYHLMESNESEKALNLVTSLA